MKHWMWWLRADYACLMMIWLLVFKEERCRYFVFEQHRTCTTTSVTHTTSQGRERERTTLPSQAISFMFLPSKYLLSSNFSRSSFDLFSRLQVSRLSFGISRLEINLYYVSCPEVFEPIFWFCSTWYSFSSTPSSYSLDWITSLSFNIWFEDWNVISSAETCWLTCQDGVYFVDTLLCHSFHFFTFTKIRSDEWKVSLKWKFRNRIQKKSRTKDEKERQSTAEE